jgi:hypothetical protein
MEIVIRNGLQCRGARVIVGMRGICDNCIILYVQQRVETYNVINSGNSR